MAIFKIFIRNNEECALYGKSRDNRHALPKLPQFRHRVQIQLPCPDIENQSKFSIEPKGREKEIFQYHQLAGFRLNSPKRSIFPRVLRGDTLSARKARNGRAFQREGGKTPRKIPRSLCANARQKFQKRTRRGGRTLTMSPSADFESAASANSAIRAKNVGIRFQKTAP